MPLKSTPTTASKASSAKKRGAPEGQDTSQDPSTPVRTGRSTENSRRVAAEGHQELSLVPPSPQRTIKFMGYELPYGSGGLSGSPGRVSGRSRGATEFPPANYPFFGDLPRQKLRDLAEEYLRLDCKQTEVFYDDLLILIQIAGTKDFKVPTKVHKYNDFLLLSRALDESPDATIYARLEWTATPPMVPDTDAAALGSGAATMGSTATKKKRGNASSSMDALNDRPSAQEVSIQQKENAGRLYSLYTLCDGCKHSKNKDCICWDSPRGPTYHMTVYNVAQWAEDMRKGEATEVQPSERVLNEVKDKTPAARGKHAARAAAAALALSGSQPSPTAVSTTVTGAIATNSFNHVVTLSPSPPPTRTPLGDASSAANAAFANFVQAEKVLTHWPIIEWARKLGDHHVALATKLFEQGIDTMRALAYMQKKGALKGLQLAQHQEAILEMWVTDWEREDKSFEDYQKQNTMSSPRTVTSTFTGRPSSA